MDNVSPSIASFLFYAFVLLCTFTRPIQAQLQPSDLSKGYLVQLTLNDRSHFYGIVLSKPVPGRILFQTRNGRLEIPLEDILAVVDLRDNVNIFNEIKEEAKINTFEREKNNLREFITYPRLDCRSIVQTNKYDIYKGYRYLFDDSAHVIISTDWGELYFRYHDLSFIDNYSCKDDRRDDFFTRKDLATEDPKASQGFVTPTGIAFGKGNNFFADYLVGGLQMNYGATNWLSVNGGGVLLPLRNIVILATGGAKFTPFSSELWHISAGFQGMYSKIIKITDLILGYGAITYGTWESNLTVFGGYTIDHTDSLGYKNTKNDRIFVIEGTQKLEKDLKLTFELFFISNFDIVPLLVSFRYFHYPITVDVGFVFSLFTSSASADTKTIGEYIFNVQNFPIVPVLGFSYHF
jgi:hypothetical protein